MVRFIPDAVARAGAVPEAQTVSKALPLSARRAVKDEAELRAARQSYMLDGAGVCAFLAWLEEAVQAGKEYDEYQASEVLEDFRKKLPHYHGPGFVTVRTSHL